MISILRIDRKALPPERQASLSSAIASGREHLHAEARRRGEHVVVLSTCERYEVFYGNGHRLTTTDPGDRTQAFPVTLLQGREAVEHLFRVAAGLDSRLVGEPHVLGQLRIAMSEARNAGTLSREMARLFQAALRAGRRARAISGLGELEAGYATRVADRLAADLAPIHARRIVLVGGGTMSREVAAALRAHGGLVAQFVGRHADRVRRLAGEFGAAWSLLPVASDDAIHADIVITTAAVADPIVTPESRARWVTRLFVDLGVVPNVDPALDGRADTTILRLDAFAGLDARHGAIATAEHVVVTEVDRFLTKHQLDGRRAAPASGR